MPRIPKVNYRVLLAGLKTWGPAIVWMVIIFSASADSDSVAHSSRIIEPICRWLFPNITYDQLETVRTITRKGAHMTEFALLAVLLLYALSTGRGNPRKWLSSAWVLSTAYAAADEFHQLFVVGRNGSVWDVVIDSTGAALGLLICYFFLRARSEKAEPGQEKLEAASVPASPLVPPARPSFGEQLLCTLQGEDFENRSQVRLSVQDRLQRENGGRLILGRNPAAHLCVKNTSISGQHLSLIFRNGQFEVEDLNSSNGTRVNGRRIVPFRPVTIADGDRIEAGEVLLHFHRLA